MAEITLNELAALTNRKINTVRQDVKRNNILKSDRGKIDESHPTNLVYIRKYVPDYVCKDSAIGSVQPREPELTQQQNKLASRLQRQIERELEQDISQLDLESMGEQELKEQLLRERIISAEKEREYKIKQTMLSDTKRRKMEGDLIDTDWVVATLGHGLAMYKREIKDGIDTLLSTIFSEHGIKGEDKTRYTESFIDVLAIAHKEYEYRLTKQVEAYSPDKMEGAE